MFNTPTKKFINIILIAIFIAILASFGAIALNFYLFPKLSTYPIFSKYAFLKKAAENTTIINKTEQVVMKEDSSVNKIASQVSAATVEIISIPQNNQLNQQKKETGKTGNGIVVTGDGVIATYRTAINEIDSDYKILMIDGSAFQAKLIGIDEFTNIAYLRIESSDLPAVSFANSDDSFAGKKLIAVGNSFSDYVNKYSSGLLSNINKTFNISGKALSSSEKLEGVFDLDFANESEYIGSPVIDFNGELIGIIGSTTIDSKEKFFAIPSNVIRQSIDAMIKNELDQRPVLGIYYISITKPYATLNNLNIEKGARIFSAQGIPVISGSAAEKAGFKNNDIVTSVDEKEIDLSNPLSNLVNSYKKGDTLEFTVSRNGQETKLTAKL